MLSIARRLIDKGEITSSELEQVVAYRADHDLSFVDAVLDLGILDEQTLAAELAQHHDLALVDIVGLEIDSELLRRVPAEIARKHTLLPLKRRGNRLAMAMYDPDDLAAIDAVSFATDFDVQPVVCERGAIKQAVETFYAVQPPPVKTASAPTSPPPTTPKPSSPPEVKAPTVEASGSKIALPDSTDEAPIVAFVNNLIDDASRHNSSDIHLEHYAERFRIRYRVDGMLHEVLSPPAKYRDAIVSRLKIMAGMDIAERRLPQDGAIRFENQGNALDVRVSTTPTIYGEKLVLRLLDKSNINFTLEQLGFEVEQLGLFKKTLASHNGVILVTGPTGSGKTTTLYSAIRTLNDPKRNIMTVEEPVEYDIDGINQVNANPEIGLTFARALRSFLRQDPDVILVGEVRDAETANICIQAALTGHLVFSTVHTNDAAGTINRLMNMGVEPFMLSASLNTIVAQRLLRRVCSHCSEPVSYPAELLARFGFTESQMESLASFRGHGCQHCMGLGYRGQIGIFEILPVDNRMRSMIGERAGLTAIRQHAEESGMLTLCQSAIAKFKRGQTTLEEIERVLG
ncbi:Flp pilus assembly complex ATPase component TadA [bacterium]|nr:Flp pilus assembly complex ATPase component TadA [bacterium]